MRRKLSDVEAESARSAAALRRAAAAASLEKLKPGDVVRIPVGRRAGLAIVLDPGLQPGTEDPRPVVLTEERQVKRLSVLDFPTPGRADRPGPNTQVIQRAQSARPSRAGHHHEATTGSTRRTKATQAGARRPVPTRSPSRSPTFARSCVHTHATAAPTASNMPDGQSVIGGFVATPTGCAAGSRTARTPSLASSTGCATCSTTSAISRARRSPMPDADWPACTASSTCWRPSACAPVSGATCRRPNSPRAFLRWCSRLASPSTAPPRLPRGRVPDVLDATMKLWGQLAQAERDRRLDFLREPAPGFVWAAFRWASGASLDSVLTDNAMSAGDFVRWIRQLLDLLGQIAQAADDDIRPIAERAMDGVAQGSRGLLVSGVGRCRWSG